MNQPRVAVIFGGVSSEHEISRLSAASVIRNLSAEKYELSLIGITKKGEWLLFGGDPEKIPDGSWEQDPANRRCMISPDASRRGITVSDGSFVPTTAGNVKFMILDSMANLVPLANAKTLIVK